MPEYSGSLLAAEAAAGLWLIPGLPLLAALLLARGEMPERSARLLGIGGPAAALLAALVFGIRAWQLPEGHQLHEHLWTLVRVSVLDFSVDLALDRVGAVVAVGAAALGTWAGFIETARDRRAAIAGVVSGLAVVACSANLFVAIVGWQLAGAGVWWLARPKLGRALGHGSDALAIAFLALLVWMPAGDWSEGGVFVPDLRARLAPVQNTRTTPTETGPARFTMTALPGATLRSGSADLCLEDFEGEPGGRSSPERPCRRPLRSPFTNHEVEPSLVDLVVDAGPAVPPLAVPKTRLVAGGDTEIVETTSTIDFRQLKNQLELRDDSGSRVLRHVLAKRLLFGLPALAIAGWLLALAAALGAFRGVLGRREDASRPAVLLAVAAGAPGVLVAYRLSPWLDVGDHGGAVFPVSGAMLVVALGIALALPKLPGGLAAAWRRVGAGIGAVGTVVNRADDAVDRPGREANEP